MLGLGAKAPAAADVLESAPSPSGGMAGVAGSMGPRGYSGAAGVAGTAGRDGSDGSMGPRGCVGSMGPAGMAGASGAAGVAGSMGPRGYSGAAGSKGDTGMAGAAGSMGPRGYCSKMPMRVRTVLKAMPAGVRRISIDVFRAFRPLVGKPRQCKLKRLELTEPEKGELARDIYIGEKSGQVYRIKKDGRVLQLTPQAVNGYSKVNITLCGKGKWIGEHHLRLLALHGDLLVKLAREGGAKGDTEFCYPDDWFPDHIDRNPLNNDASNLRPFTLKQNIAHSYDNPNRKSSAAALSRGVVIVGHKDGKVVDSLALKFPVGTEFASSSDASRETGIVASGITQAAKKNMEIEFSRYAVQGLVFELMARENDVDPPWRVWTPQRLFCKSLGGCGVRVSNDGWLWHKKGNIKTQGTDRQGSRYRVTGHTQVHQMVWRVWNGNLIDGKWIAAEIPEGLVVCHGGPGRALAAERIIGGFERNWPADLRVDTRKANSADMKHEADALLQ